MQSEWIDVSKNFGENQTGALNNLMLFAEGMTLREFIALLTKEFQGEMDKGVLFCGEGHDHVSDGAAIYRDAEPKEHGVVIRYMDSGIW